MGWVIGSDLSSGVYNPYRPPKKKRPKGLVPVWSPPSVPMHVTPIASPIEARMRDISVGYHKVYGKYPAPDKVFGLMSAAPPGMDGAAKWAQYFRIANPLDIDPTAKDVIFERDYSVLGGTPDKPRLPARDSQDWKKESTRRRGVDVKPSSTYVDTGREDDKPTEEGGGSIGPQDWNQQDPDMVWVPKDKTQGVRPGRNVYMRPTDKPEGEWVHKDSQPGQIQVHEFSSGDGVQLTMTGGTRERFVGGNSAQLQAGDVSYVIKVLGKEHYVPHYIAYKKAIADGKVPDQADIDAHKSYINLASWVSSATGDNSFIDNGPGGKDFDQWSERLMNAYTGGVIERYLPYFVRGTDKERENARKILLAAGMPAETLVAGITGMQTNEPDKLNTMLYDGFIRWRPPNQSKEAAQWEYLHQFGKDAIPVADQEGLGDQQWGMLDDIGQALATTSGAVAGGVAWLAQKGGSGVSTTFHHVPGHGYVQGAEEAVADSVVGDVIGAAGNAAGSFTKEVATSMAGIGLGFVTTYSRLMTTAYWMATAALWDKLDLTDTTMTGKNAHDYGDWGVWDSWKRAYDDSGAHVESFVLDGAVYNEDSVTGKYSSGPDSVVYESMPDTATPIKQSSGAQWVTREIINDVFLGTGLSDNPEDLPLVGTIAFCADMAIGLKFDTIGDKAIRYGFKGLKSASFKGARAVAAPVVKYQGNKLTKKALAAIAEGAGGPSKMNYVPGYVRAQVEIVNDAKALLTDGPAELRKALQRQGLDYREVNHRMDLAGRKNTGGQIDVEMEMRIRRRAHADAAVSKGLKDAEEQMDAQAADIQARNVGHVRGAVDTEPQAPIIYKDGVYIGGNLSDVPDTYQTRLMEIEESERPMRVSEVFHEDIKEIAGLEVPNYDTGRRFGNEWGHIRYNPASPWEGNRIRDALDGPMELKPTLTLSMGMRSSFQWSTDAVSRVSRDLVEGGFVPPHSEVAAVDAATIEKASLWATNAPKMGGLQLISPQAYKALTDAGIDHATIAKMQHGELDFPDIDELIVTQAAMDLNKGLDPLRGPDLLFSRAGGEASTNSLKMAEHERAITALVRSRDEAQAKWGTKTEQAALEAGERRLRELKNGGPAQNTAAYLATLPQIKRKFPKEYAAIEKQYKEAEKALGPEGTGKFGVRPGGTNWKRTDDFYDYMKRKLGADTGIDDMFKANQEKVAKAAKLTPEETKLAAKREAAHKAANAKYLETDEYARITAEREDLMKVMREEAQIPPAVRAARESAKPPEPKAKKVPRWDAPKVPQDESKFLADHPPEAVLDIRMSPEDFAAESRETFRLGHEAMGQDVSKFYENSPLITEKRTHEGTLTHLEQRLKNGDDVDAPLLDAYIDEDGIARIGSDSLQNGDHRAIAAQKLGMKDIPVKILVYVRENGVRRAATAAEMKGLKFEKRGSRALWPDLAAKKPTRAPKKTPPLPVFLAEPLRHSVPTTMADWTAQMRAVMAPEGTDAAVIDRLGALMGAGAAYTDLGGDDFVTRYLLGVVRGETPVEVSGMLVGSPVFKEFDELAARVPPGVVGPVKKATVQKYGRSAAEAGRQMVRDGYANSPGFARLADSVGYDNMDAMGAYYVLHFGEEAKREMEHAVQWMRTNRVEKSGRRGAVRANGKTMLSIDISTNCTYRKSGRPCIQCYVEEARGGQKAGVPLLQSPHKVEEIAVTGKEFDEMPDAMVDFFNTQHGGMRMHSAGDFDASMVAETDKIIDGAKARVRQSDGPIGEDGKPEWLAGDPHPLKIKAITKQREFLDRYMMAPGADAKYGHVTADVSIDYDPTVTKGVIPADLQRMMEQDMRQAFANSMTLEQAKKLYDHPRIFRRYVVMFGRGEALAAAAHELVDNITVYHSPLVTVDDRIAAMKFNTPSLFPADPDILRGQMLLAGLDEAAIDAQFAVAKEAGWGRRVQFDPVGKKLLLNEAVLGEPFLRKLAGAFKSYHHATAIAKGGHPTKATDVPLTPELVKKSFPKKTYQEGLDELQRKLCCTTHKCGSCFTCSGLRSADQPFALAAALDGVPMASVQFAADGRALVRGLTAPTPRAMAHEIGHIFRRTLTGEDAKVVKRWAGLAEDEGWNRDVEELWAEKFADHFDEYVATGTLPDALNEGVMKRFTSWLTGVWANVRGTPLEKDLNVEVRKIFDRYAEPLRLEQKANRIGFAGYFTKPGTGSLPLMLSTHAEFIAKLKPGAKSEWWIKYLYNLPDEPSVRNIVKQMADEPDPVKVMAHLTDLADDPYGVVIDGWQAATYKMWRMKYRSGTLHYKHPALFQQMLNPLMDASKSLHENADTDILALGTSIQMGSRSTEGLSAAGKSAHDYASEMYQAQGVKVTAKEAKELGLTAEQVAMRERTKSGVWSDFWADIQHTMEQNKVTLGPLARRNLGVKDGEVTNMWEYWEAYSRGIHVAKGKPKAAFVKGRFYKGEQSVDAEGNITVKETSGVVPQGTSARLAAAVRAADDELDATIDASDVGEDVKLQLRRQRDRARLEFERYKENPDAFMLQQPFFEGQRTKGYTHPVEPALFQKFMAGRVARAGEFAQAKQRGGLLGYSVDEWTTAYKELVMSTMGFPMRVTLGDEGVRLITEGIASPFHPARTMANLKRVGGRKFFKKGAVQEMIDDGRLPENVIEDLSLWTRSHSDDFVTIHVGAPKHIPCFKGELRMVANDTTFKAYSRFIDESGGDIKKATAKLRKLIQSDTPEGAAIRLHLVETQRISKAQADRPSVLKFTAEVKDDAVAEMHRLNPLNTWLQQWTDYMEKLDNIAFDTGDKVTGTIGTKTLREMVADGDRLPPDSTFQLIAGEKLWPVVMQNDPWMLGDGGVKLPVVHWFAQNVTFKLMSSVSDRMRSLVFTSRYAKELEGIKSTAARTGRDIDDLEAARIAGQRAMAYTNSVQYTHNATVFEDLARNTIMFMPAYRQYLGYWSKYALKEPLVMARLQGYRYAIGDPKKPNEYGDYSTYMPSIPFGWDTPSFAPGVTVPVRVLNALTQGRLRGIESFPGMSFTNPRTSVLSRFDDLLWGMTGLSVPALSSDKTARQILALRIAQGQISNGITPNPEQGLEEMRRQPGWSKYVDAVFGAPARVINGLAGTEVLTTHPEAILSFTSKQFLPTSWSYMPKISRDMMQAEFEWTAATTNDMRVAVLEKYPLYGRVVRYRKMGEKERERFLLDEKNVKLLPILTGKNNYDNAGQLLDYGDYYNALQRGQVVRKTEDVYGNDVKLNRDAVANTRNLKEAQTVYDRQVKDGLKWAEGIVLQYTAGKKGPMFRTMMSNYADPHYTMMADGTKVYEPQAPFNGPRGLAYCPPVMAETFAQVWGEKPLLKGHRPGGDDYALDRTLPGWHPPSQEEIGALYKAKKLGVYGEDLNYTKERSPYFKQYREQAEKTKMAKVKNALNMSTDGFWDLDTWGLRQLGVPVRKGWDDARLKHNYAYSQLKNEGDRKKYFGTKDYNEAKAKYIAQGEQMMDKYAPFMRFGVAGRLMKNKYLTEPQYDPDLHLTHAEQLKAPKKTLSRANQFIDVLDKWYANPAAARAAVDKALESYGAATIAKAMGGGEDGNKQAAQFLQEEFRADWWKAMITLFYRGREHLRLTENKYHKEYLGTTTYADEGKKVLRNLSKNVIIIQEVEKSLGIKSGFVEQWRELGGQTLGRALLDWSR